MPGYRLYFINPVPKHIRDILEFSAPDDLAAIEVAEEIFDGRPMELWQGDRVVRTFHPPQR